jgi:hypothetical protein
MFIGINFEEYFNAKIGAIETITARKIIQPSPKERRTFMEIVDIHFQNQNLYDRLKTLMSIPQSEWMNEHKIENEKCDRQMITGMLTAEQQTKKTRTTAWSPTFSKAVLTKAFSKIIMSLKINHKKPSARICSWADDLGIPDITAINIQRIKKELRSAQKSKV